MQLTDFQMQFGKHAGKKIGTLIKEEPAYVVWAWTEGVSPMMDLPYEILVECRDALLKSKDEISRLKGYTVKGFITTNVMFGDEEITIRTRKR